MKGFTNSRSTKGGNPVSIEAFDHPALFLVFMTFAVFALAKIIAYGAGKVGLTTLQSFFVPGT